MRAAAASAILSIPRFLIVLFLIRLSMASAQASLSEGRAKDLLVELRAQLSTAPDYRRIGRGWHYPESRAEYALGHHRSSRMRVSRERQQRSMVRIDSAIASISSGGSHPPGYLEAFLGRIILEESGIDLADINVGNGTSGINPYQLVLHRTRWTSSSVVDFVDAEAIYLFRCFNELVLADFDEHTGGWAAGNELTTMSGDTILPAASICATVMLIMRSIIQGNFPSSRFHEDRAMCSSSSASSSSSTSELFQDDQVVAEIDLGLAGRQTNARTMLAGLTDAMSRDKWTRSFRSVPRESGTVAQEAEDLSSSIWATKVGGPSHGFDFESQCVLPLLANARHKAVLLWNDRMYAAGPVGRAHIRLLEWQRVTGISTDTSLDDNNDDFDDDDKDTWLLFIEPLNIEFAATLHSERELVDLEDALVQYALSRAEDLGLEYVSFGTSMSNAVRRVSGKLGRHRVSARLVHDAKFVLTPSNAVVEASDTLSGRHDWVQETRELSDGGSTRLHVRLLKNV